MEVSETLPPEPTSAAAARRLTEQALRTWRRDDLVEVASLLVSELVTNAVLHAGSDIDIRVMGAGDGVRVEIGDGSSTLPARRSYGRQATTGRGLGLVELLATAWGAEPRPAGKVVWFQVDDSERAALSDEELLAAFDDVDGASEQVPPLHDVDAAPGPASAIGMEGSLRALPVALYRAMLQHDDALLREYMLCSFATPAGFPAPGAGRGRLGDLSSPATGIGAWAARVPLWSPAAQAAVRAAWEADQVVMDLQLPLAADAREACAALLLALDEADGLARAGQLLVSAPLPEVRACRQWCLGEIIAQIDGESATAFHPPSEAAETLGALTGVEPMVVLNSLHDAVVVGDDENRIRFVNAAAERLLGWSGDELAGQRITVLVPEHLREAHVVGYSRHLVTDEPRLLGRPVRVPARHRSGREVQVDLLLSGFRTGDGRRMFAGSMREVAPETVRAQTLTAAGALTATSDIAAMFGSSGGSAVLPPAPEQVLKLMGRHLGCQVALLWWLDAAGEQLSCVASWDDGSAAGAGFRVATLGRRFAPGVGVPGRVWELRQPVWVADVVGDTNFTRAGIAVEHGVRSALAFPIVTSEGVRGVVEFLSREVLDANADVIAIVSAIGRQLGAHLPDPA